MVFDSYEAAWAAAYKLACDMQREVGIERASEFGREVYRVKHLPNRENRYGWELRCEVVLPSGGQL